MGMVFVCWRCGSGWSGPNIPLPLRCGDCNFQPLTPVGNIPGVHKPLAPFAIDIPPPPKAPPVPTGGGGGGGGAVTAAALATQSGALRNVAPPTVVGPAMGLGARAHSTPFRSAYSNSWEVARVQLEERATLLLGLNAEVCEHLRGAISVLDLCRVVNTLTPRGAPSGLTPERFRRLFESLFTGLGRLPPARLSGLVEAISAGGNLTPVRRGNLVRRLTNATVAEAGEITPTNADLLIRRLCPTVEPETVYTLLGKITQPVRAAIRPNYLLNCCPHGQAPDMPALGNGVPIRATRTLPAQLAQLIGVDGVDVEELQTALIAASHYRLPHGYAVLLANLYNDISDSGSNPRLKRVTTFLRKGDELVQAARNGITWATIFNALRRLAHGNRFTTSPFAAAGMGGGNDINVAAHGDRVQVTVERLNYFCNAHCYSRLNFTDRIQKVPKDGSCEFWINPLITRADVRAAIITAINLPRFADAMDAAHDRYADTIIGDIEVGIRRYGGNYVITHFSPVSQDRVSRAILELLKPLF